MQQVVQMTWRLCDCPRAELGVAIRQLGRRARAYAELTVHHLPQPKGNRIYEVCLQHSHGELAPTKALFSVTSSGDGAVVVSGSLKGIKAVLVTEEPAGGMPVPTTKPVIITPIS